MGIRMMPVKERYSAQHSYAMLHSEETMFGNEWWCGGGRGGGEQRWTTECLAPNVCCHNFTNCRFICWPFYDKNHMLISIFVANYPCIAVWKGQEPSTALYQRLRIKFYWCHSLLVMFWFIMLCDNADISAYIWMLTLGCSHPLPLQQMLYSIHSWSCQCSFTLIWGYAFELNKFFPFVSNCK